MTACPDDSVLEASVVGTLDATTRDDVGRHVATCEACSQKVRIAMQKNEATGELGAVRPDVVAAATLKRGSVIGRYVVLEVLGAGGMGEVYSAIDPELDRRVAIKLVKTQGTSAAAAERQTRLLREAQAMAKLSHPNVVSVFDVGVVEGRVFLAMELVDGTTLTHWLDEKPRTWREVIAVFKQAGTGLSAAHHAGMIHRDFKPDNILIGKDGRVRVSDFGLARAASTEPVTPLPDDVKLPEDVSQSGNLLSTPLTQGVLGTPGYMAPEQLLGTTIDEKSDQFSFCVSLYRALYRETPFWPGSLPATIAAITAGQVRPVPTGSTVPAWVRKIVLRGLSAAPQARFESIDQLLTALDRDPERTRRRALGAAAVALGVVALGAVGVRAAQVQSQRCRGASDRLSGVWDSARQTAIHDTFVKTGAPYAEDVWKTLKGGLDRYANDWVAQSTESCEATWVRGEQSDAVLSLRSNCLNDRLDELRALTEALTRLEAASMPRATSATNALTVLSACADVASLERRMPLPKNEDVKRRADDIERALHDARSQYATGRYLGALPQFERIANDAKALDYPPLIAESLKWLAKARGSMGKYDHLREIVLETIRYAELSGDDSTRFQSLLLLANLGMETGQPYEELNAFCRLAESALARIQDRDWHRAKLEVTIGNINLQRGRYDEALAAYQRGLKVVEGSPLDLREQTEWFVSNIADVLFAQGHLEKALAEHQRGVAMSEARLGTRHPELGLNYGNIGQVYLALSRFEDALRSFEHAEDISRLTIGLVNNTAIEARTGKGEALLGLGRATEAETVLRQTLSDAETLDENSVAMPALLRALAHVLAHQGKAAEALPAVDRAIALERKSDSRTLWYSLSLRGQLLFSLGRLADAEKALDDAERAVAHEPSANEARRSDLAFSRAEVAWALHRPKNDARALAQEALTHLKAVEGDTTTRREKVEAWLTHHPAGP